MSSLDDIKKKLNIDEIDKETRNSMFNKFVEKGGKVIQEVIQEKKKIMLLSSIEHLKKK